MSDASVAHTEQPQPVDDGATPTRPTQLTTTEVEEPTSPTNDQSEQRVLAHVERVYKSSETRTPIVVASSDGDPFYTVTQLARREGCAVWSIVMGSEKNEQNALDYIEVGTQNGDWVYLTNVEKSSPEVLRQIALTLYTLKPEPKLYPRRSLFRLILVTDTPIDVKDTIRPVLPQSMLQLALVARARVPVGVRAEGASPEKILRRMPVDKPQYEEAVVKHDRRREVGRDSDSETDTEEPEKKVTGLWFHRSVDFYNEDGSSTVARVNEVIFDAVEKEKVEEIVQLANSGRLNVDKVKRDGMNPLMWAVSRARANSVKTLLDNGADVHVRRESDNCPLLFMCIESEEILTTLLNAGANIDERYEGYRLESHPTTMPHIAAMIRELKGIPPVNESALELAAQITKATVADE